MIWLDSSTEGLFLIWRSQGTDFMLVLEELTLAQLLIITPRSQKE
jgi:hypothetical protein